MPSFTFTSDRVIGTQIASMGTDTQAVTVIAPGVLQHSISSFGISGFGNNQYVYVGGTLIALTDGVDLAGDDPRVVVAEGGQILSRFTEGVDLRSGGSLSGVTNHGTITGSTGIRVATSSTDASIRNTGRIESMTPGRPEPFAAFAAAIDLANPSGNARVHISNSGEIVGTPSPDLLIEPIGRSPVAILQRDFDDPDETTHYQVTLENAGRIVGEIVLGNEADRVVNSGVIDGDLNLHRGSEAVINTGTITGDVDFGSGFRLFRNLGTINGDVLIEGLSFSDPPAVRNAGVIGGDLELDGSDFVSVIHSGTILGRVLFDGDNARFSIAGDGFVAGVIVAEGEDMRIIGGRYVDQIFGAFGDDTLTGRGGDDVISGRDGNDQIRGNDGADELEGDGGNDLLLGARGDDTIFGGDGRDTMMGGDGADEMAGDSGNDDMSGGAGSDDMTGGGGNDVLRGGDGNDAVRGDSGNDVLSGQAGDDLLIGGSGNDRLLGSGGNDTLNGGTGRDIMDGGVGADVFLFAGATDSRPSPERDVIIGFEPGDLLDLSRIASSLVFSGSAAAGGGQASVWTNGAGGGTATMVRADTDGNGTTDMEILLSGARDITVDDFILG